MTVGAVELWHGELAAGDEDYRRYWRMLDVAEQAQALAIKNELRQKRYVTVHGRLRIVLAQAVNKPPETLTIKKAEHGKPYLADHPELAFNLSDTANALVIAVARGCRLGADIEQCRPRANLPALADKCFSEVEAAYWRELPEDEKTRTFYQFWTRKEAFVKAIGRGIALGLHRCVINPVNPAAMLRVPESCGQASIWHLRDIDLSPDICCALAADRAIGNVRLIPIDF